MSDLQRGSPDDQYINVHDGDEVRHWATVLQVTAEELNAAVRTVGSSALKVRDYLALGSSAASMRQPSSTRYGRQEEPFPPTPPTYSKFGRR
jgi:hypothetical protein